ncbi:MAG: glycoside hydrolase family 78 protein [Oscillospiraceae bacterium]|nr:glycoside hydrolase family 78 protein [Oscillospiraceae bacterium]
MHPILQSNWIKFPESLGEATAEFLLSFPLAEAPVSATLQATALGIYAAQLNGQKVGGEVLAPGWTNFRKRLQYQTYDVTSLLAPGGENTLAIAVGRGWRMQAREQDWVQPALGGKETALIAALELRFADGSTRTYNTDSAWRCREGKTRMSNIYNGETYDAGFVDSYLRPVEVLKKYPKEILIPLEGERIVEVERLPVQKIFTTPEGEVVLDFGQNMTGYVEFKIEGAAGKTGTLRHAEILDAAGNFYTENLRGAAEEIRFICDGNAQTYKPTFSFQGFRYVQPKDWPCEVRPEDFTAIVVHSEMKRTGFFECSEPLVNQLFHNIVWGQKGNFLDVPTDCPQRDERLGWTGDAQVFCRTASYLFDCERFFKKWLADLASEQFANGGVPHVIPRMGWDGDSSTGWADAAVICPWQMYLTFGDKANLHRQFASMRGWVDYMIDRSEDGLWNSEGHFSDWLHLEDLSHDPHELQLKFYLQNAYLAYSTALLIKAGTALGIPVETYQAQLQQTKEAFVRTFIRDGKVLYNTQTTCAIALYFDLAGDAKESIAAQLAGLVRTAGHLTTGFLGTPYLLHALSSNGYTELAYDLLLRREFPSWLYPVTQGATTIWERWDGQRPDGSFQNVGMNSFNHYAYGAIGDWLFGVAAGIQTDESTPGFRHILFAPQPDARLEHLSAAIETRFGRVESGWKRSGGTVIYNFTVPEGCTATAHLGGRAIQLAPGKVSLTIDAD